MKNSRITRAFSLKNKLLLGTVGLGVIVVPLSNWTTYNKTKTFVRSTTSFGQKTSLEPKNLGSRFWGRLLAWLARAFTKSALKKGAITTGTFGAGFGAGYYHYKKRY